MSEPSPSDVRWLHEHADETGVRFRIGVRAEAEEVVAEWTGFCTLVAARDGSRSELRVAEGADAEIVDKVHRGLARALLRHLGGGLTLHGSAAVRGGRAVACIGESDTGKSTAAAHLTRRAGASLLADDTIAVDVAGDVVTALPGEDVSWLLPDARAALGAGAEERAKKLAVVAPLTATTSSPLAAIVRLRFDDALEGPVLRRLRGQEALAQLVPCVIRFVIDDPGVQMREFEQLRRLVDRVPVHELARPRDLAQLDAAGEALASLLDAS